MTWPCFPVAFHLQVAECCLGSAFSGGDESSLGQDGLGFSDDVVVGIY